MLHQAIYITNIGKRTVTKIIFVFIYICGPQSSCCVSDFCYHSATQLYPRSYTLSYAVKFQWQLGKFGRDLKLNYQSLAMLVMILIWQYRICLAIWNIASQSTKPAQWMVDCKWKEDVFITSYHFYRTRVRSLAMLVSHSLTDSLTPWRLVNLIDATLVCKDANSILVEVVTVADVDDEHRVGNSLLQIWSSWIVSWGWFLSDPSPIIGYACQ